MNETAREAIFHSIRRAIEPVKAPIEAPIWESSLLSEVRSDDLWASFASHLLAVNGTPLVGLDALGAWLIEKGCSFGYCDAEFAEDFASSSLEMSTQFERSRVDAYQFGITRAAGAIASTGTVILEDRTTSFRLAALAPWIHAAILHPRDLHPDLVSALEVHKEDPSVIWVTGPSKTADVEGILIEGAHGPGIQVVCLDDAARK